MFFVNGRMKEKKKGRKRERERERERETFIIIFDLPGISASRAISAKVKISPFATRLRVFTFFATRSPFFSQFRTS